MTFQHKKKIKRNGFRLISTILGIISPGFMIYNYIYPDTTVKTAGVVAMSASTMLNRASTLVNFGCGQEEQRKQLRAQEEHRKIFKQTTCKK